MNEKDDIFGYIQSQEDAYKQPITLAESWQWSMYDHIRTSYLYNNSQLLSGKNDFKPVKNITRPILNLQHRAEDIDVKDVQLYVNDKNRYHLSFLVKKYHDDVFVVENDLDTFFDELNVSRIDYGGGLSKKLDKPCPETVPLQSVVFCDQTDMLSGPIGIKHFFSPDQLLDMEEKGWGKEEYGATISLQNLIALSRDEKKNESQTTKTPGRYIEVYEVHGNFPKKFADPTDTSGRYETRIFIVAFYKSKTAGKQEGVILFTAPEKKSPFKLIKRDPVFGRGLGFGGAEELFEPQVWVNYDMIRMQDMLNAASKTILKHRGVSPLKVTTGKDLENLEIVEMGTNDDLAQVDTYPRNIALFEKSVDTWEAHAQQMGAANDSIMGQSPSAGTPFKLQELVTTEAHSLHDYRTGIYAKHLEEIFNDWIIPHIQTEITKGITFLSELSLEEMQYVTQSLIDCEVEKMIKEKMLKGVMTEEDILAIQPQGIEAFKQSIRTAMLKKGNKHFIEILKNEFKETPLAVKVNIKGKQKNLAGMVDKITNIFRFAFSNPQGFAQVMQIPGMASSFNEILEFSGLSPADFSGIEKLAQAPQQQPQPQAQPSPIQPQQQPLVAGQ